MVNTIDSDYIRHIRLEATRKRIEDPNPNKPEAHVKLEKQLAEELFKYQHISKVSTQLFVS